MFVSSDSSVCGLSTSSTCSSVLCSFVHLAEHVVISLIPAQFSVFAFLQLVARCCREREREQSISSSKSDLARAFQRSPGARSSPSSVTGSPSRGARSEYERESSSSRQLPSSSRWPNSTVERKDSLSREIEQNNRQSFKHTSESAYDEVGSRAKHSPLLSLPVLEVLKSSAGDGERSGGPRVRRQGRDGVASGCFLLSQLRSIMTHFIADTTS